MADLTEQQLQDYIASLKTQSYTATNPTTGLVGAYDIIPTTWAGIMRDHPELNLTWDRTPEEQDRAAAALARDEMRYAASVGLPVTAVNMRLIHFFGPQAAAQVVNAPPGTPLSQILPASWITQNPAIANWTSDYAQQWAAYQVGQTGVRTGIPPAPIPGGQTGGTPTASPSLLGGYKAEKQAAIDAGGQDMSLSQRLGQGQTNLAQAMQRFRDFRKANPNASIFEAFRAAQQGGRAQTVPLPTQRPTNPANTDQAMPMPAPNPNRFMGSGLKEKATDVPVLPSVARDSGPASPIKGFDATRFADPLRNDPGAAPSPQTMGMGGYTPKIPGGMKFALPQGGAQQLPTTPASALPGMAFRGSALPRNVPAGPNPGWGDNNTVLGPMNGQTAANTLAQMGAQPMENDAAGAQFYRGGQSDYTAPSNQQAAAPPIADLWQSPQGNNPAMKPQPAAPDYNFATMSLAEIRAALPYLNAQQLNEAGQVLQLRQQQAEIGTIINPADRTPSAIGGAYTPVNTYQTMAGMTPKSGNAANLIGQLGGANSPQSDNYIAGPYTPVTTPGYKTGNAAQLLELLGGFAPPLSQTTAKVKYA